MNVCFVRTKIQGDISYYYSKDNPDPGWFVSLKEHEQLRARIAELEKQYSEFYRDTTAMMGQDAKRIRELELEVARLRKALESTREYLMGGKWIYDKSPDEFIKAELEASDG